MIFSDKMFSPDWFTNLNIIVLYQVFMLKFSLKRDCMTIVRFKNFINLTDDEKRLVLEWRNSDRVRLNMLNKDIIPLENHLRFIDSLKNRNDCKYWLFMIDEIPIGVFDLVDIKPDGSGGVGGSYIGDINYNGYGLLLNYLLFDYCFENNKGQKKYTKEDCFYVMKNNPRTYKMHKNIFGAKDFAEDDEKWYLYIDYDSWVEIKDNLKKTLCDPLEIEKVIWEI